MVFTPVQQGRTARSPAAERLLWREGLGDDEGCETPFVKHRLYRSRRKINRKIQCAFESAALQREPARDAVFPLPAGIDRPFASPFVLRACLPPHPGPLPRGEGESPAARS